MREVVFYFDVLSPNAYLAWTQLESLERKRGVNIQYAPVLFAGILDALEQRGPAEIPAKREWMFKNIIRKAALHDIPIRPALHHPFNPLPWLRSCCVPMQDSLLAQLVASVFRAIWIDRCDPGSEAALAAAIGRVPGLGVADTIRRAKTPAVKEGLRTRTDEAIEKGVFGVPSMLVDDELFFGFDDIPFLEAYLDGADTLDADAEREWVSVTPSAVRRQVSNGQNEREKE